MFSLVSTHGLFSLPILLVILVSAMIGLLMVLVFRYTSDQKAIHTVKDQLKAHLLAVRLFQDQLPVVLSSYGHILSATGRYLKLAFRPLLYVMLPLIFLIVQLDRYLGFVAPRTGQDFLLKAHTTDFDSPDELLLQLPSEMVMTAPAVHLLSGNEVVWRVKANKDGNFVVNVVGAGQTLSKQVVVSSAMARVSPIRLRGRFWERAFVSGEAALPNDSPVQSIEVSYPARTIYFARLNWNWISLFFVLSLAAGFLFKSVLRIEI